MSRKISVLTMVHSQVTRTCTKGVPSWQPPLKRCVMSDEQEQDSSPLMPIEQQTIMFYGKPLVVVRLPDGRPGIVLRNLCDNLQLEPTSQVRRIKRTEAIADDLVYSQIQTDGGPQIMPTLVLRAAPFWLLLFCFPESLAPRSLGAPAATVARLPHVPFAGPHGLEPLFHDGL